MYKSIFLAMIVILLFTSCETRKIESLKEYYSKVNYSCINDQDCVIKNIGNCCGTYPKCVNKASFSDPDIVNELCTREKIVSVCGFPVIESCKCETLVCVSK